MKRLRVFGIALASMLLATAALAGDGYLGIQLTNGSADIAYPAGQYYLSAGQPHSEVGVGIQYWRLMSNDYAFNFSATYGTFSETDKPGTGAAPTSVDQKYTQTSYSFRFGGDRAVKIGERAVVYFGPGIEYWTGKAKFTGFGVDAASGYPTDPFTTSTATRYALTGRVGGMMMLSRNVGFNCQVGRYIGVASAKSNGAEASWWPSGFQASGGLVIKLPM